MEGGVNIGALGEHGDEAEDKTVPRADEVLREWSGVTSVLAGHRRWWQRLHFNHRCQPCA